MLHSLLDNENDLIKRSDERVEDIYRLGSLFKVWYYDSKSYDYNNPIEIHINSKLDELIKDIDWIDTRYYTNEFRDYPSIQQICEKISKLVLNYSLRNDMELYKLIKNKKFRVGEVEEIKGIEEYLKKCLKNNLYKDDINVSVRIQQDDIICKINVYIDILGIGWLKLKFEDI